MLHETVMVGDRSCPRGEILTRAARAAAGFHALGIVEGDAVALLLRNDFAVLEATRGANTLGAYTVPLSWHSKTPEVRHILTDARPKLLIVHADLYVAIRDAVLPEMATLVVLPIETTLPQSQTTSTQLSTLPIWHEWLDQQGPWDRAPKAPRGTIIYTSGTTGRPKGVKRLPPTPEQAARYNEFYRRVFDIRPGIRVYLGGPLYHSTANAFARAALEIADLMVLQSRFDAQSLLRLIDDQKLTHLILVPTMFVRLLHLPENVRRSFDVSSLQRVYHTGAPCPPEVKRAMIDWFGPVLHEIYGSTEVGATVFGSSQDWLTHPGTVGRPIPETTLRILDDSGNECPTGTAGEIFMRCTAYPDFVYHNDESMRRAVERDGLISCGDVGYVDAEGFLYLCDRKRDMLISGGVNLYPAEIESVLITMPGVEDCAIFGVPDTDLGEAAVAIVQPRPGATLDEARIRAWLKERLSNYKVPKRVLIEANLPRAETGKISKALLRQRYISALVVV